MWKCEACGRMFQKQNQNHACGKKPETVEEYLSALPAEVRQYAAAVRNTLRGALPEADETISWGMPTFRKRHNIIHFAAHRNHIGLYAGTEAVEAFAARLKDYQTSKGTIRFQYCEPIPLELIADIAGWCYETGNHP